jgi:hypothetical protein
MTGRTELVIADILFLFQEIQMVEPPDIFVTGRATESEVRMAFVSELHARGAQDGLDGMALETILQLELGHALCGGMAVGAAIFELAVLGLAIARLLMARRTLYLLPDNVRLVLE